MHGRAGAVGSDQPIFGVGTANPCHALEIVAARTKPLTEPLDTPKAVHTVVGGVPVRRHGRDYGGRACIKLDGHKGLSASRSGLTHRPSPNMGHSRVAFSLHSTLSLLGGIHEYLSGGYEYRVGELGELPTLGREFLLRHRLFRSDRTGETIDRDSLKPRFPFRWKYNVLRALDYLR